MNRFAAVPVLALVLAVACQDGNSPDRARSNVAGPSFQVGTENCASVDPPSDCQCTGTVPPGTYQNVIVPEGATCTIVGLNITGNITALARSQLSSINNTVGGNIQAVKAERVLVDGGSVGGGISIVEGPGTPPLGFHLEPFDYDIRRVTLARDIYLSKNRGFIFVTENTLPTGNITAVENVIDLGAQLNINTNAVEEGGIHVLKNKGGNIRIETNRLPVFGTTPGAGNVIIEDNDISDTQLLRIAFNRTLQNVQVFKNTGAGRKQVIFNRAGQSIQCKENTTPFTSFGNLAPKEEDQCPELP